MYIYIYILYVYMYILYIFDRDYKPTTIMCQGLELLRTEHSEFHRPGGLGGQRVQRRLRRPSRGQRGQRGGAFWG